MFSDMWKTDSLGLNGFRAKNYSFIQDPKHWAIGGVDYRGYSKQELMEILGKPNESGLGKEDELCHTFSKQEKKIQINPYLSTLTKTIM
jgi:hypothetical protein